ncbi:hypothetical protein L6452_18988 [Arctium lappa]|uniref:Uncharacterized protein n=1 Tax=Arctium lappa TaxID=4217 RepID=A0ACB9B8Q1_ARCLA|nr:hypothetical protein L6452_18988 [Arctium lappa]
MFIHAKHCCEKGLSVVGYYVIFASAYSSHHHLHLFLPIGFKLFWFTNNALANQETSCSGSHGNIDVVIAKVQARRTDDEIFQSLVHDQASDAKDEGTGQANASTSSGYDWKYNQGHEKALWGGIMGRCCCHILRVRKDQEAINMLRDLENSQNCRPGIQSYNPLPKLCFRTGKLDAWLGLMLDEMIDKHYLSLDLSTYTLLIHGLCRANKCDWASRFFQEMIVKDIRPRYYICSLLLDEIK